MSDKAEKAQFRVVRMVPVITYQERVLIETDDWRAAEAAVMDFERDSDITMHRERPVIRGVHPTHDFSQGMNCANAGCRSYNNGSYGSHAPCGTDFQAAGKSLMEIVEDWRAGMPFPPGAQTNA